MVQIDGSKKTGSNRQVEIDGSKQTGQNIWVQIDKSKYTSPKRQIQKVGQTYNLKRRVQIGGPNQN